MMTFSFVLALGLERSGAPEAYYYTALELIARVSTTFMILIICALAM
jgi:hypothetical protein